MILKLNKLFCFTIWLFCTLLLYTTQANAFGTSSHRRINETAAQATNSFNAYLTGTLGLALGMDTKLRNDQDFLRIIDWIGRGGEAEDQLWFDNGFGEMLGGLFRSVKHFHQPLHSWGSAGFQGSADSSLYWAQNSNQWPGRKASWFDGRDSFLSALTATTEQKRNADLADTFQTLGQIMHLVSDAASVAHTRDDRHIWGYNFERFVAKLAISTYGAAAFDTTILQQETGDPSAPVPIAFLWDTDFYNGTNPAGDMPGRTGIAEFSNANFFSEDTINQKVSDNPDLPFPAVERLTGGVTEADPRTGKSAKYLSKAGDGVAIRHMVRVDSLSGYTSSVNFVLDDRVYRDYADYLIPRAIGYSAGILDYFFRGRIKIEAPDRFVYAVAPFTEGNASSFTRLAFKVSNDTVYPNVMENTSGPGQMWAVVRYRTSLGENLLENPFAGVSEPHYAVAGPLNVDLTRLPQEVTFDFSGSNSIPANAADVFLWAIWQGKLGQEEGALMVGGKDLFEPDPVSFGNGTDYDCWHQTLYHVADLAAFPAYSPPDQVQRDISEPRDGRQDLFGPFENHTQFIKTSNPSAPLYASPELYDFKVSRLKAESTNPQYARYMILQDQPLYHFSWFVSGGVEVPSGIPDETHIWNDIAAANLNDFVSDQSTGKLKRRVTPSFLYRGVPTFFIEIMVVGGPPRYQPCASASWTLPEPFVRVDGELKPEP